LAYEHTINNWTFAIVTAGLVLLLPRVPDIAARALAAESADPTPLEFVGIDRPFTAADIAGFDEAIGLESAAP